MCQRTFYICYRPTLCQCALHCVCTTDRLFYSALIKPCGIFKSTTVQTCCNLFLYFVTVGRQKKKNPLSCRSGISRTMYLVALRSKNACGVRFQLQRFPFFPTGDGCSLLEIKCKEFSLLFPPFFLHRGVTFRTDDTVEMNEPPVSRMLPSMCWLQDD